MKTNIVLKDNENPFCENRSQAREREREKQKIQQVLKYVETASCAASAPPSCTSDFWRALLKIRPPRLALSAPNALGKKMCSHFAHSSATMSAKFFCGYFEFRDLRIVRMRCSFQFSSRGQAQPSKMKKKRTLSEATRRFGPR